MIKITKRDRVLIQCLRENSRFSLTQISKKTRIPISTLYDRLKAQQDHTIQKHTTIVNFDALGYTTRVHMAVVVSPQQRAELQKHLEHHTNINNVFEIASSYDFMLEAVFKSMFEVKEFIGLLQQRFPSLQYNSFFVTRDVKREGFFAS